MDARSSTGSCNKRVGVASRNPMFWDGLQDPHVNDLKSSCMNARLYDIGHQEKLCVLVFSESFDKHVWGSSSPMFGMPYPEALC